ncbi:MAG TPA: hypothetical protein VGC15_06805 [Acetobacteraceae bacterium]
MADVLLELPAPPDQRVRELHAWIATHRSGAEGIISADLPGPLGEKMHMPLVSSRRDVAVALEPFAKRALFLGRNQQDPAVSVRLVTFKIEAAP